RHAGAGLGGRQLVRARGLRPLRRPLPRPPRPAPHPHVPGVRGPPAAQGLPQGEAAAAGAPAAGRRRRLMAGNLTTPPAPPSGTRRVVMGFQDPHAEGTTDLDDAPDLPTEPLPLNMGPSHPAMHGTVRMVLEVEGEKISSADVQIGYLH